MSRKIVLIVDDDPDIREAVAEIVFDMGYAVCKAVNGADAWEMLQTGLEPAAIILDLMMPVMSGPELFERLSPELQRRVIAVTAGRGELPGAFAQLSKPFDSNDLEEGLRALFVDG